mmetsp:Transcript_27304/g.61922  ORF Transcript_27304/g.61922 Transcript_27304/m.61922 type:complete len:562 (-) Transcript_27304:884-2569(-)
MFIRELVVRMHVVTGIMHYLQHGTVQHLADGDVPLGLGLLDLLLELLLLLVLLQHGEQLRLALLLQLELLGLRDDLHLGLAPVLAHQGVGTTHALEGVGLVGLVLRLERGQTGDGGGVGELAGRGHQLGELGREGEQVLGQRLWVVLVGHLVHLGVAVERVGGHLGVVLVEHEVELLLGDGVFLHQAARQLPQQLLVLHQDLLGQEVAVGGQAQDLAVDALLQPGRQLPVHVPVALPLEVVVQGRQAGHAHLRHHRAGDAEYLLQVSRGTRGHAAGAEDELLGHAAAPGDGQLALQVVLRDHVVHAILQGREEGQTAGAVGARHDGDLGDGVVLGNQAAHDGVPRLVEGHQLDVPHLRVLVGPLHAHGHSVDSPVHVVPLDHVLLGTGGVDGCLVQQVLQRGSGQAGCAASHLLQVHVGRQGLVARVHLEDVHAAPEVGHADLDLAVEAARAHQGLVQDVHPVRGRDGDHALVALEAVHLHQQLVQSVLALVVAPRGLAPAALAPHRVDLVDEEDAGCGLPCLLEQIPHPGGPHAHKHLHEIRARDGEEGHIGLARGRLGQ